MRLPWRKYVLIQMYHTDLKYWEVRRVLTRNPRTCSLFGSGCSVLILNDDGTIEGSAVGGVWLKWRHA